MAIRISRWALLTGTALICISTLAAEAQPAAKTDAAAACTPDADGRTGKDCGPRQDARGSTYLTPLVVSGAAEAGGVGDPYATPKAVSTVGRDDINQFGGQNLDNVLRTQPGTFTRDSPQNPGIAVNIRGFEGSGRVTQEIDGARQNFRFTGHEAQGFTYVDPALLSGIDITRGASDAVGGAGALAGVANFRTLEVDDLITGDKPYGGFTSLTAGTNGDGVSEAAAAAYRVNDTFAILGAISKRNNGDYANGDGDTVPFTAQDILSGLVKAEITPTLDSKLTVSGLDYNDHFTANGYRQTVNNQTYTARYDYTPADNDLVDLHLGAYYNDTRMHYEAPSDPATPPQYAPATGRVIDDRGWGVNATNTSRGQLGEVGIKSTYGFEYSGDDVDVLNSTVVATDGVNPSGRSSIGSLFSSTTLSVGIVDVTGGLRYDHYTANGTAALNPLSTNPLGLTPDDLNVNRSEGRFDPSITIALNPVDWFQPYVSYAETFRPPTINELLTGGGHPTGPVGGDPGIFSPNPLLQPEIAKTWEVGANFRRDDVFTAGDSIRLKADYFHSDIDNYVTATFTGATAPAFYDAFFINNPGTSHVQGIEVQAAYDAGAYFASLGYTHTHTDLPAQVSGFGASQYLPDDIFSGTFGVRLLEQQNLTLGTRLYAVSDTSHDDGDSDKGYNLVDLFANYKFDNGVELGANVSNVFDTSYTPALSYTPDTSGPTGRGRTFEATLKASF